ncbi:hypothetical protein BDZ45DRAFT_206159 [Acephala macrosclerotiorum]|nr:hypothetical protein BDZ45DRAFT_206159 [Acephala macrosclerotiorum]
MTFTASYSLNLIDGFCSCCKVSDLSRESAASACLEGFGGFSFGKLIEIHQPAHQYCCPTIQSSSTATIEASYSLSQCHRHSLPNPPHHHLLQHSQLRSRQSIKFLQPLHTNIITLIMQLKRSLVQPLILTHPFHQLKHRLRKASQQNISFHQLILNNLFIA